MRLFSSLVGVLLMFLVASYSLMEGKAGTESFGNNTVHNLHRRNLFEKRDDSQNRQVCGLTPGFIPAIKRQTNDYDVMIDYDSHDVPNLDKILGGNYATYGEFPWMVEIRVYNFPWCGGAIVNEFWVITAAHCLYNIPVFTLRVLVGNHMKHGWDAHEETFTADRSILHEWYDFKRIFFDIGLIKITARSNGRGIQYNNYVQPVCLAKATEDLPEGTPLLFSGWGNTGGPPTPVLKKVTLPIVNYNTCMNFYAGDPSPKTFCAGHFFGDTDLCKGDSGGPAVYKSKEGFILYGIGSAGTICPPPNYASIFSSIPKFRDWIDNTINRNSKDNEKILPVRAHV